MASTSPVDHGPDLPMVIQMIASLTVQAAEGNDQVVDETLPIYLGQDIFVGRDDEACLLSFNSVYISRLHFRIYSIDLDEDACSPPPLVYCEDRMSANGTYVNDALVGRQKSPRSPYLLSDGDIITIRPYWRFRFNQPRHETRRDFTDLQKQEMRIFDELYKVSDRILGSGRYGTVYAAGEVTTQNQLACKIVDLVAANAALMDHVTPQKQLNAIKEIRRKVFQEVEILAKICHPNILSLFKAYYSDQSLYIFSELAPGGDLLAFIAVNGGFLEEISACVVCHQLAIALDFLHSKGIAHRDLKPENILVMRNVTGSRVVISDFGAARHFNKVSRMMSLVGTPEYLAPEFRQVLRDRTEVALGYTEAIDLWSLGVVTYCVLSGAMIFPFKELHLLNQAGIAAKLSMRGQHHSCQDTWAVASCEARNFVEKLLVLDVPQRMTAEQAVGHDWFRKPKGREMELRQLHERTRMAWNKRPTNINLIEPLPVVATKGVQRKHKKLPDATASPYFGLEKHLHANSVSNAEVRRNCKRIIDHVKKSRSTFLINTSESSEETHPVPSPRSRKKISFARNSSPTALRSQSDTKVHVKDFTGFEEASRHLGKFRELNSSKRAPLIRALLPPASLDTMLIPEVNPNDLFGTTSFDRRTGQVAGAAIDQSNHVEGFEFDHVDNDRGPVDEMNLEISPSPSNSLQELGPPATVRFRRHQGKKVQTIMISQSRISEPSSIDKTDILSLSSTQYSVSPTLTNPSRQQDANSYVPTDEEEQLAISGYHSEVYKSRTKTDEQQPPVLDYSIEKGTNDDAQNSLQPKAIAHIGVKIQSELRRR